MTTGHVHHDILEAIGGVPNLEPIVVEAKDVQKWFGKLHVLKGVSVTVRRQEVVVVIGPSGSGKTTFIRCINHLEKIQAGRILVNGRLIERCAVSQQVVDSHRAMAFKIVLGRLGIKLLLKPLKRLVQLVDGFLVHLEHALALITVFEGALVFDLFRIGFLPNVSLVQEYANPLPSRITCRRALAHQLPVFARDAA
jgi:energy-coupling factor transporter ATP-binding protein EcfA2